MSDGRINEQILKRIRYNSKGDDSIVNFLIDLIYTEAEHPGQWWWKDAYKKKIKEYIEKWGGRIEYEN